MNAIIGLKLQVTATLGFHSLYDLCFQNICLFSGVPDNPEDNTVTEQHGGAELYLVVHSMRYATRTEYEEAQEDVAHKILYIAKP
jgi:hypothetical protein